jgi:hypothetical protein
MKNLIIRTFIFSFFVIEFSNAQNFFPLDVGDALQFNGRSIYSGPGGQYSDIETWNKLFVIKDTLIGGQRYIKTSGGFFGSPEWLRYDPEENKLWLRFSADTVDRFAVDFNVQGSYTSYINKTPYTFTGSGIIIDTILGQPCKAYKMIHQFSSYPYRTIKYTFAEGVGLYYYSSSYSEVGVSGFRADSLKAFRINNNVFNNMFGVSINQLGPLSNRPINAFPFYMSINYSAQVPSLIESLYLEIWHYHNNINISYQKLTPVNNQFNISFTPNSLMVGDTLKLRARIVDGSIFRNSDSFPDTGFAYIVVLPPITEVESEENTINFSLQQNYPNPFNPSTVISWQSPVSGWQTIKLYDLLGREIDTIIDGYYEAGKHSTLYIANSTLPSGVYFYQLKAGEYSDTKKMILIR